MDVEGFLFFTAGTLIAFALYFLPTIFAGERKHPSGWGILAVNLFLGWTIIGWVGALAWSLAATGRENTPSASDTRPCPRCAEAIKRAALVCRFCGHEM